LNHEGHKDHEAMRACRKAPIRFWTLKLLGGKTLEEKNSPISSPKDRFCLLPAGINQNLDMHLIPLLCVSAIVFGIEK